VRLRKRDLEKVEGVFRIPIRIRPLSGQDGHLLNVFARLSAVMACQNHGTSAYPSCGTSALLANRKGVSAATIDDHTVEEFACHLGRCRRQAYCCTRRRDLLKGTRLFIGCLRRAEPLPTPSTPEAVEDSHILLLFRDWMRKRLGKCDATLQLWLASPCTLKNRRR